jgi:hypothetical protein
MNMTEEQWEEYINEWAERYAPLDEPDPQEF